MASTPQIHDETATMLREKFERLFAEGRDEDFEDGMMNNFTYRMIELVETYKDDAIKALAEVIESQNANPAISAEALHRLGYIKDAETHDARHRLMEYHLQNKSSRIQDGALGGLSLLDDPAAIPALQAAIEVESLPELRKYMHQTLAELEQTLKGAVVIDPV